MLRLLVLALLIANAAYFAWSRAWLASYGLAPATQSEPQRLAQQLRPEAVSIVALPAGAAPAWPPASSAAADSSATAPLLALPGSAAQTASSGPAECLQIGLFNEEQTVVLRARLQSVMAAGSWVLESSVEPARWTVYMGKYSNAEAVEKKRTELRQLRVAFEPLNNPSLEPGLSLGSFATQAEAEAELARIATRGVRTAKVIQTLAETRGQKLRLPAVTASLRPQLDALKPQLAGKALKPCA